MSFEPDPFVDGSDFLASDLAESQPLIELTEITSASTESTTFAELEAFLDVTEVWTEIDLGTVAVAEGAVAVAEGAELAVAGTLMTNPFTFLAGLVILGATIAGGIIVEDNARKSAEERVKRESRVNRILENTSDKFNRYMRDIKYHLLQDHRSTYKSTHFRAGSFNLSDIADDSIREYIMNQIPSDVPEEERDSYMRKNLKAFVTKDYNKLRKAKIEFHQSVIEKQQQYLDWTRPDLRLDTGGDPLPSIPEEGPEEIPEEGFGVGGRKGLNDLDIVPDEDQVPDIEQVPDEDQGLSEPPVSRDEVHRDPFAYQYKPDRAYWLFKFASAVYDDFKHYRSIIKESYKVRSIKDHITDCDVSIFYKKGEIIVAFRGTESLMDGIMDMVLFKSSFLGGGIMVHHGMELQWLSVRKQVIFTLRLLLQGKRNTRVYFTGHSLGSGLAQLASLDLVNVLSIQPIVYGFGSPRVLNQVGANAFHHRIKDNWLVFNQEDNIAKLPPYVLGYRHSPKRVVLIDGGNYIVFNQSDGNLSELMQFNLSSHLRKEYDERLSLSAETVQASIDFGSIIDLNYKSYNDLLVPEAIRNDSDVLLTTNNVRASSIIIENMIDLLTVFADLVN